MQPKKPINLEISPQLKSFGVPALSLVVLVLLFLFAVLPLWSKVLSKQKELGASKERLTQLTEKETKLKQQDSSSLDSQFQIAEIALPSGKEVPALLVGISHLYSQQGMELVNLKITPGKVSTDSATPKPADTGTTGTEIAPANATAVGQFPSNKRLDFDLVLKGTLEQSRGFLATLEKSLRLMMVNSFTFSKSTEGSTQLTLKITAPFEPLPQVPDDFAEALPTLTKEDMSNLDKLSSYTPVTTPFSNSVNNNSPQSPFGAPATPSPSPTSVTPSPTKTTSKTSSSSGSLH